MVLFISMLRFKFTGIQTKGIPIPTVRALTFVDPHITLLEVSMQCYMKVDRQLHVCDTINTVVYC